MKLFPIIRNQAREDYDLLQACCPVAVPYELVAAHEPQVQKNHGQTAARLAERGGLSPAELAAVLEDREFYLNREARTEAQALPILLRLLADHLQGSR